MSVQLTTIDLAQMRGKIPEFPFPRNGWVAGGAVRGWFTGAETLSDVDVFFPDSESLASYVKLLENAAPFDFDKNKPIEVFKRVQTTPNAITLSNGTFPIQCIHAKFYPDIAALLDSFDFTVCQFAWDGTTVYTTGDALISVLRDHLGVHVITKEGAVDSLRRAFKYCKKGFHPCNGSLLKIADSLRGLTEQEIRDAVTISPNGGRVILRFD